MTKNSDRCMQSTEMQDTCTGNHSLPHGGHRHTEHSQKHSTNTIILLPPLAEQDSEDVDPAAVPGSQTPELLALDVGALEVQCCLSLVSVSQRETTPRQPHCGLTQTQHLPLPWRPPDPDIWGDSSGPRDRAPP